MLAKCQECGRGGLLGVDIHVWYVKDGKDRPELCRSCKARLYPLVAA